jgi:hypothetical protein
MTVGIKSTKLACWYSLLSPGKPVIALKRLRLVLRGKSIDIISFGWWLGWLLSDHLLLRDFGPYVIIFMNVRLQPLPW